MIYVWPGDQDGESVLAKCVLHDSRAEVSLWLGAQDQDFPDQQGGLCSMFPRQRQIAHQLNYLSITLGPNLEFQTSVL